MKNSALWLILLCSIPVVASWLFPADDGTRMRIPESSGYIQAGQIATSSVAIDGEWMVCTYGQYAMIFHLSSTPQKDGTTVDRWTTYGRWNLRSMATMDSSELQKLMNN